ncbi:MAG: hypothetical protein H6734_04265 [Alphaproteobacteria bacterium]|nr:hypothetical protein [Alphaproteobacteria bacterium]
MIRMLSALVLGLSLALAPVAEAATKEEISAQKDVVKNHAKNLKSFDKLVSKWEKARTKGKDTSKMDAELAEYAKEQLDWLRKHGQPTGKKKGGGETNDDAPPWMEKLRDAAVGVKDAENTEAKKKHIAELRAAMQSRLDLHRQKLEQMGG